MFLKLYAKFCSLEAKYNNIVRRAIEDNDPSDGEVSLENCVAQALVIWWLSSNRPAVWMSNMVRQGFVKLHMPGIHSCLMKRHPILDPNTQNRNSQNEPQPGPSGQMSKKPDKYQTMEYIVLHLKSYEFDFFKELSGLIRHQRMHMVLPASLTCLILLLPTSGMNIQNLDCQSKNSWKNCLTYFRHLVP